MREFISTKRISAEPETRDNVDGMKIVYVDGYVSWCPLDVFQRDYQSLDAMSFGHALVALQKGARVCRAGWNGKGMFPVLVPGTPGVVPREGSPYADLMVSPQGTVDINPHIDMKTATGQMQPGWLASQTDMLANDWQVV